MRACRIDNRKACTPRSITGRMEAGHCQSELVSESGYWVVGTNRSTAGRRIRRQWKDLCLVWSQLEHCWSAEHCWPAKLVSPTAGTATPLTPIKFGVVTKSEVAVVEPHWSSRPYGLRRWIVAGQKQEANM
ncbi:unnamed protein product [Cuscuta campestris]|uniref:Uncharacterized protein n=1 Tax=Cuscuta campestris TaxID=132261 RepID=A0A484MWY9_9ASTE|nr:unnamed protein product [Cuscuta campestris]VFQ93395.1 unnamed protein product [Cuscuta campestris]